VNKNQVFVKLLERVLKFVAIRPRSRQEILRYLQKKIPKNEKLLTQLVKEVEVLGLIDDREFAYWWVEQRITFRPKGKKALFFELRQKGVDKEMIEEILSERLDEIVLARKLAQKKWLSLKNLPPKVGQQKLVGFLSRRGFSWQTVKKVVDEIDKK
jgi:regulatory protein